jgi:hypothetical protein
MKIAISILLSGVFCTAAAQSAWATDPNLWLQLGNVIGSEEFCGLHYDQDAIKFFIEKHVDHDDMQFIGDLDMHVSVIESHNKEMSTSQKTAHCAQVTRVARSYGFIK